MPPARFVRVFFTRTYASPSVRYVDLNEVNLTTALTRHAQARAIHRRPRVISL